MKQLYLILLLCAGIGNSFMATAENYWQRIDAEKAPKKLQVIHPNNFLVYTLDEANLKLQLWNLSTNSNEGITISLPLPDGTFTDFIVWQTPIMPDALSAKYPDIKTFTAKAINNAHITAKIEFTVYGLSAMIYDGDNNTSFIDPYDNFHDGLYIVHYKKDETRAINDRMKCLVRGNDENGPAGESMEMEQKRLPGLDLRTINGYQLRTYRLALSANNFYCQAATGLTNPTIAQALSKMTVSLNRVNGVYEREFSITMNFVTNEDTLIWTTATGSVNGTDPFNAINSSAYSCLTQNQTECDTRIGDANYDIGHVFTTGAGGLSEVGCTCQSGIKAKSATGQPTPVGDGFDIDYVSHEMGHEYGADHPFNSTDGNCGGGNLNLPTAFEPGSGSTIMAYAGICDPDDLQYHSDAYFHGISLQQIVAYTNGGRGDVCAVKTATGNKLVNYPSFSATYSIPYLTPFELAAPTVSDSVSDTSILYCWEEWDTGTGLTFVNTHAVGPIFRSYYPTASTLRVFPKVSMVMAGILSNAGTEGNEGEKVPDVARTLNFKCTFRDIINNLGCVTVPDDVVTLNAINTGSGFAVTSQENTGITYSGNSTQTITWNVVNTNLAPINAANVDIYMSLDSGNTWYYSIGTFPNTGVAFITVPNPATTINSARFKVKGSDNVFFNVNSTDFTVTYNPAFPESPSVLPPAIASNNIQVFPVPATDILYISTGTNLQHAVAYNSIGQEVWQGEVTGTSDIEVNSWARGVYYMRFINAANGSHTVKSFVIR